MFYVRHFQMFDINAPYIFAANFDINCPILWLIVFPSYSVILGP